LQGKAIWILGFFSFLAGLSAIHAIVLAVNLGIDGTWQPYFIGGLIGGIPVYVYLLISILVTLAFLGATSSKVVTELSNKTLLNEIKAKATNLENGQRQQQSLLESMQARVFLVDEGLNAARKEIDKKFNEQEKELKQVHTSLVNRFDSKLADVKEGFGKQLGDGFSEQAEMLRQFHTSLVNRFDSKLADANDVMMKQLAKVEENTLRYSQRVRKSAVIMLRQRDEIAAIKSQLDKLESEIAKPKPQLTSKSDPEAVRGIGPTTKEELKEMGITTVEQLILTDPKQIAEKTTISEKTAEKLQGIAQLSMVPSVREKDLVLLEEVGVMNRKELASQDPIELGRKINGVFDVCVEKGKISDADKPTIEEIYSWIKFAKT
jgi:predicted flap endonuclease-1-like 5' DNA nuclease